MVSSIKRSLYHRRSGQSPLQIYIFSVGQTARLGANTIKLAAVGADHPIYRSAG